MFRRSWEATLAGVSRRRLLAGAGYATAALGGVAVAVATAGCGSGGNGALSTALTLTRPTVSHPVATTSQPEGATQTTVTFETTTETPPTRP
jgi:hypothetical protein